MATFYFIFYIDRRAAWMSNLNTIHPNAQHILEILFIFDKFHISKTKKKYRINYEFCFQFISITTYENQES